MSNAVVLDLGDDLDELSKLLDCETFDNEENASTGTNEKQKPKNELCRKLSTIDIFQEERQNPLESTKPPPKPKKVIDKVSEIHDGNTDSSDDEDNKYAVEHQNYTESGRSIKDVLKKQTSTDSFYSASSTWKSKKPASLTQTAACLATPNESKDVYRDPFFGIRIINPLISSQSLREKMVGKTPVSYSSLEKHLITSDRSTDWVVAGVIVSKFIKTSQKGNPYVNWTLSDLRDNLQTISVFLFGKAYKNLWKTSTQQVVAILNATPLDNSKSSSGGSKSIATLSVMNSDQVMMWGQSKDLGVCKARKKNGEPCTAFINKNQCDFCVYHVKQEYRKFSARSELQAASGGSLSELRNKVLGKNEVFYGGKSFTAVVAKPSRKQTLKDKTRLSDLFSKCESRFGPESMGGMKKPQSQAQSARVQLMRDAERLQKLKGTAVTLTDLSLEGTDEKSSSSLSNKKPKPLSEKIAEIKAKKQTSQCLDKKIPALPQEPRLSNSTDVSEGLKVGVSKPSKTAVKNSTANSSKKVGTLTPKPTTKTKSNSILSRSQSTNPTTSGKKVPTKNRFENLTKLKSVHEKEKESDKTSSLKKGDLFDVCFEFENNEKSSNLFGDKKKIGNDESKSKMFSKGSEEKSKKVLEKNCKDVFLGSKSSKFTLETSDNLPLRERKPPHEEECRVNKSASLENPLLESKISPPNGLKIPASGENLSPRESVGISRLGSPSVSGKTSNAKAKALKYIKTNGPIKKEDPNMKKNREEIMQTKRKRFEEETNAKDEKSTLSQRFKELMNVTSKHLDLISNAENEAIDAYYEKMEKKEQMEEKMLTTYKLDCKAFKCLKCKYKWFSPSDLCKSENHPIKVVSAVKRFFQCHNCRNRTVSLELIPMHSCGNCGQANWERAPMMRERKCVTSSLSIRGGEQTFVNSVCTDTNLNLLVPDD